ncbi:phage tail protein [Streptomyces azureus]|uniref:Phage tail protein n=1 Tax=Streptomyces azureus TaxID=146537 RepID=A0A0K8PPU0_STRAJ|nr:phage tail protein [Streptomyces azureus]
MRSAGDRSSLIRVRRAGQDDSGRTWMDIRSAGSEEVSVRAGRTPETWLTGLGRPYS